MKKKLSILSIAIVSFMMPLMAAGAVEAKSVKWSCIALDPATPWVQTCYSSTRRP